MKIFVSLTYPCLCLQLESAEPSRNKMHSISGIFDVYAILHVLQIYIIYIVHFAEDI
jgi:hypothetical protein